MATLEMLRDNLDANAPPLFLGGPNPRAILAALASWAAEKAGPAP